MTTVNIERALPVIHHLPPVTPHSTICFHRHNRTHHYSSREHRNTRLHHSAATGQLMSSGRRWSAPPAVPGSAGSRAGTTLTLRPGNRGYSMTACHTTDVTLRATTCLSPKIDTVTHETDGILPFKPTRTRGGAVDEGEVVIYRSIMTERQNAGNTRFVKPAKGNPPPII